MEGHKFENVVRTMSMTKRFSRKISPAEPAHGNFSEFCHMLKIDQDSEVFHVVEVADGIRKERKLLISKDSIVIAKPIDTGLKELTYHLKGKYPRNEVTT